MVESLLGEFPLRDWETYLLTSLTMSFFERDSKAIEILDENIDNLSKESPEIIDISLHRKNNRFESNRLQKYKQDGLFEIQRLHLTIDWDTVSFLDHVKKDVLYSYSN